MKKKCFVLSIVLHVLFIYWFTTLKFTHKPAEEENKSKQIKKEIIVVRPVKLFAPREPGVPAKKMVLTIDSAPESLKSSRGETGARPQPVDSGKKQQDEGSGEDRERERKIVRILEPIAGNSSPSAAPRFSLNPGAVRNIISGIDRPPQGKTAYPGNTPGGIAAPGTGAAVPVHGCNIKPWARRAIIRVKNNWSIPPEVEIGIKGLVGVSIIVEKNGKISAVKIKRSSRAETLDKAALTAFALSDPLPELPRDFPYHNLTAYFLFNYNEADILQNPGGKSD